MENAHVALHLSRKFTRRVLVLQPRRPDGTFASPVPFGNALPSTFHATIDGEVVLTR